METIEKSFNLPSNGYFGDLKKVTLRAMTTREQKILYTAKDPNFLERIVKSCCVDPKDLDLKQVHLYDLTYLVYMLRELTFGPTYDQDIECPVCGNIDKTEISILKMEVTPLELKGLEEILTIELPKSKDKLKLKLNNYGDTSILEKSIRQKAMNGKLDDPEGYEFYAKLAALIELKNGEPIEDDEENIKYIENLHLLDTITIQNALDRINFGIKNTNNIICSKCGEEIEVRGIVAPEFFRPTK